MISQGFRLCGIIWDHLESCELIWGPSGNICDHAGSSVIIWGHMCPCRLTRDRLGSSWIIWDRFQIHSGSPGRTIWEVTSEEKHQEGFWEGLSHLMRKHLSATICKLSTEIAISFSFWKGIGCEPLPKMHKVLRSCVENEWNITNPRLWKGSSSQSPCSRLQNCHQHVKFTICSAGRPRQIFWVIIGNGWSLEEGQIRVLAQNARSTAQMHAKQLKNMNFSGWLMGGEDAHWWFFFSGRVGAIIHVLN